MASLGALDKPTSQSTLQQLAGKSAIERAEGRTEYPPEGNLLFEGNVIGSTRIESPIFPVCFPTRVTITNNQGRAEFELNAKDLKWRRVY
ncbi:MAG: hypothetical protein WC728_18060 [Elusimicrobiota bacterium]